MKLTVNNKKDFINSLLGSISNLNDSCVLKVEDGKISATLASTDSTLFLFADIPAQLDGSKTINIPDVKKFVRVLESVNLSDEEPLVLTLNSNNIKFANDDYKFTYHLLEDGIIKAPTVSLKRISELNFDTTFKISESEVSNLMKGSSFATDTNKLYIYCENNKIYGELGDKTRHNSDNFQCILAKAYEGVTLTKAFPVNFETFRLINFSKAKDIEMSICNAKGVIRVNINKGDTKLIYIVSALIN